MDKEFGINTCQYLSLSLPVYLFHPSGSPLPRGGGRSSKHILIQMNMKKTDVPTFNMLWMEEILHHLGW
jgi:hypothetical protein